MRPRAPARSRAPSQLLSLSAAHMALSLCEAGRSSATKTYRNGRPQIVVFSEVGPDWEIKIGSEHTHLFAKFFEQFGGRDGLLEGHDQTATRRSSALIQEQGQENDANTDDHCRPDI
jgi:hypothetical protein